MPKLILMVGLPFSGKTTRAKELEKEYSAIRFNKGEWQIKLFGDDAHDPEHKTRGEVISEIIFGLAYQLLEKGLTVILDFGFWSLSERKWFKDKTEGLGYSFALCSCKCPDGELEERMEKRNKECAKNGSFVIPLPMYQDFVKVFEEPTADEGEFI